VPLEQRKEKEEEEEEEKEKDSLSSFSRRVHLLSSLLPSFLFPLIQSQ
jgi:hypothetical protein